MGGGDIGVIDKQCVGLSSPMPAHISNGGAAHELRIGLDIHGDLTGSERGFAQRNHDGEQIMNLRQIALALAFVKLKIKPQHLGQV